MKRALSAVFLLLFATIASAQGPGHGPGGPGPGGPGGPGDGPDVLVGSDGTAYVTRAALASDGTTHVEQLVAISATGATLWTATLSNHGPLVLSGSNLITVSGTKATTTTAATSTLTALSASTGTVAWTLTVDGIVTSVRPNSIGGVYGVVVKPPATTGAAPTRSLISVSSSGTNLFTVAL